MLYRSAALLPDLVFLTVRTFSALSKVAQQELQVNGMRWRDV